MSPEQKTTEGSIRQVRSFRLRVKSDVDMHEEISNRLNKD